MDDGTTAREQFKMNTQFLLSESKSREKKREEVEKQALSIWHMNFKRIQVQLVDKKERRIHLNSSAVSHNNDERPHLHNGNEQKTQFPFSLTLPYSQESGQHAPIIIASVELNILFVCSL